MRVCDVLSEGKEALRNALEAELLLSFVTKFAREYFLAHPEAELRQEHVGDFRRLCERRKQGTPVAHLTNHREFFGFGFYVDERVLIPRPETEILVEEAIRACRGIGSPRLCDVGTGSGCIAVALAKHIPEATIHAVDISGAALEVARKNAEYHGLGARITFSESDLLSSVREHYFDGVVANLPYIGLCENHLVSREVAEFEPKVALFGGDTGLELYEKLFSQLCETVEKEKTPHWLIAEAGFLQKERIETLTRKYFGKQRIVWKNDLAGLPRVFTVTL